MTRTRRSATPMGEGPWSLEHSEQVFRGLFEGSGAAMSITTMDGRFVAANPAMQRLLGRSLDELRGRDFLEVTHPDDRERNRLLVEQMLERDESSFSMEKRYLTRDGRTVTTQATISVIRDADGAAAYMTATLEDITALRDATRRAQDSASKLNATLESMTDALYVVDASWRFTYLNQRAGQLLRRDRDELVGRNIWEEFPEARHSDLYTAYTQAVATRRTVVLDAFFYPPLDVWFEVNAYPGDDGLAVYFRDITQRRAMEQQLLRTQRIESLGTLASGVAHDLNNVLAPILTAVDLLRAPGVDDETLELLDTVKASARRGADLVEQILSFARGVDDARVDVDVVYLLDDLRRIVRETFPKSIELIVDVAGELPTLQGDATQLQQVLVNLALNARDAMPNGGVLTVTARRTDVDTGRAGGNVEATTGPHVVIEVADTGVGMDASVRARAFDPFFTTKRPGAGTGLGLSTVATIVRSHGGFVELDSDPDVGSRFLVHLPVVAPPVGVDVPGEHGLQRGEGVTVLVVDDEAAVRAMTRQSLETFGYEVLDAQDGYEALDMYAEHGESIDVVLTDAVMPVADGPTIIAALRRLDPKVMIVAMSGLDEAREATVDDVTDVISKPFTTMELLEVLYRAVDIRRQ